MLKATKLVCLFLAVATFQAVGADANPARPKLSAAEIVDKNVSARGGLQAWRLVQSITMTGKMEAGGNSRPTIAVPGVKGGAQLPQRPREQAQLPFVMELKRPRKTRLEIQFNRQTAVQVYDGNNGWKLRPFLNRKTVEPFTADEVKAASLQSDLDGPLVDYAAKGTKIELEGMEKVENRDNYKLKLMLKNGETQRVWIDAQTFLETKIEGNPRRLDGKIHSVQVYLRNYKPVEHLMMPHVYETAVDGIKQVEKIQIDTIVVNPKLD